MDKDKTIAILVVLLIFISVIQMLQLMTVAANLPVVVSGISSSQSSAMVGGC